MIFDYKPPFTRSPATANNLDFPTALFFQASCSSSYFGLGRAIAERDSAMPSPNSLRSATSKSPSPGLIPVELPVDSFPTVLSGDHTVSILTAALYAGD